MLKKFYIETQAYIDLVMYINEILLVNLLNEIED